MQSPCPWDFGCFGSSTGVTLAKLPSGGIPWPIPFSFCQINSRKTLALCVLHPPLHPYPSTLHLPVPPGGTLVWHSIWLLGLLSSMSVAVAVRHPGNVRTLLSVSCYTTQITRSHSRSGTQQAPMQEYPAIPTVLLEGADREWACMFFIGTGFWFSGPG